MRFSKTGLWGKAIYFAKNALYSNSYRFNSPAGKHQFFLVEVLLGDFVELAEKKSLTLPPNNPNGGAMYDSVKGNTGNSDVYMVYHPSKAYPRYLVTYTI